MDLELMRSKIGLGFENLDGIAEMEVLRTQIEPEMWINPRSIFKI